MLKKNFLIMNSNQLKEIGSTICIHENNSEQQQKNIEYILQTIDLNIPEWEKNLYSFLMGSKVFSNQNQITPPAFKKWKKKRNPIPQF